MTVWDMVHTPRSGRQSSWHEESLLRMLTEPAWAYPPRLAELCHRLPAGFTSGWPVLVGERPVAAVAVNRYTGTDYVDFSLALLGRTPD